jgi:hypothetical protein
LRQLQNFGLYPNFATAVCNFLHRPEHPLITGSSVNRRLASLWMTGSMPKLESALSSPKYQRRPERADKLAAVPAAELLELAIERNASHGLQLSQQDKQDMARRIYNGTPDGERDEKKKHLAKILAVSERTVRDWLSRIDKDTKESRNRKIFDLWLACYTQEEIAEAVNTPRKTVDDELEKSGEIGNLSESAKSLASHASDFEAMFYNIWKQQTKTEGSSHFGKQ